MKSRSVVVAAFAAALLAVQVGPGAVTASAADAPGIGTLDTSTAGAVAGDVTSVEPFVFVALQSDFSDAGTPLSLAEGTASFQLATWGYGDPATVYAKACPTETLGEDCSQAATASFTPADVTLAEGNPDWFDDDTAGPGESRSVNISDPDGGGTLMAIWRPEGGSELTTTLTRDEATPLNLSDGDGVVEIERCSLTTPAECTSVTPAASTPLHVHTAALGVDVSPIDEINTTNPTSEFVVDTDRAGTYSLAWHLEATGAPGVPVAGTDGTASGTLTLAGATDPATLVGTTGLPDGDYQVVGTITVTDPDYGSFSDVALSSDAFGIDRSGPALTSITASPTTIYPLINTTKRPGSTKFTLNGAGVPAITSAKLYKNSTGAFIRNLNITPVSSTKATVAWSGKLLDGKAAPAGLYKLYVYDAEGNKSAAIGRVTVSDLRLVLKTWTRTVTASGSLVDSFVGRCSSLRRPSSRGWFGSLGFYANVRCDTQTWNASAVSTVHSVDLPSAEQYLDLHVNTYGAAATSRPQSRGMIRYLTTSGNWTAETMLTRYLGNHIGPTRSATGLVFSDRSFGWGFATAYRDRYDVKKFTVVLHYKVLG